jgi:hypothetical protein
LGLQSEGHQIQAILKMCSKVLQLLQITGKLAFIAQTVMSLICWEF